MDWRLQLDGEFAAGDVWDVRGALLGIDQVGDFEVEGEVGLEVLRIAGVYWTKASGRKVAGRESGGDGLCVHMKRWSCEVGASPHPPYRSRAAMRADAASIDFVCGSAQETGEGGEANRLRGRGFAHVNPRSRSRWELVWGARLEALNVALRMLEWLNRMQHEGLWRGGLA